MYERMLNKPQTPDLAEMTVYCGPTAEWFTALHSWLFRSYGTRQAITFPYGNRYGGA